MKSDWRMVSSLNATHSEECQEHNNATIDLDQGNWNGSLRSREKQYSAVELRAWICNW